MLDLIWIEAINSCLCAQFEKTILEEKGKEKDRLIQLKESTNVQQKDTEVRKHDSRLAETHRELSLLQVAISFKLIWYYN